MERHYKVIFSVLRVQKGFFVNLIIAKLYFQLFAFPLMLNLLTNCWNSASCSQRVRSCIFFMISWSPLTVLQEQRKWGGPRPPPSRRIFVRDLTKKAIFLHTHLSNKKIASQTRLLLPYIIREWHWIHCPYIRIYVCVSDTTRHLADRLSLISTFLGVVYLKL